jgi:exopolysaccharide biosynthesis polyprenyl glycosylphosphotransferase
VPVLAQARRVLEAVLSGAEAIAIADGDTPSAGSLRRLAWELEGRGHRHSRRSHVTDVAGAQVPIRPLCGLPLLVVDERELKGRRRIAKAVFDRAFAAVALVALFPFLFVVALVIKLTSEGPVLFSQARVGLGGERFVLWKFRTMTVDAEAHLEEILHLNEHDGVLFKLRNDPRVTQLGRVLRRWSIDELPQLWNVVRGDMSMVGPRPPLPREAERYDDHVRRRLLVKPGLTGLWQVSGRTALSWEESVRLDLHYVENWSLSMDAMILAKTLSAVVRGQGAC